MDGLKRIFRKIQNLGTKTKIIILVAIAAIFLIVILVPRDEIEEVLVTSDRLVTLINVANSSTETSPLSVTGSVRSQSEAQLRTETQGEVIGVYTEAGRFVTAGTVIAELRNTSERAAVQQAQAALEAARANLEKGTGGARTEERTILEINVTNAENAYTSAKEGAVNTLEIAYAAIDDAISARTDGLFSNPESNNPTFSLATSRSETVNALRQTRIAINEILSREASAQLSLSTESDLVAELNTTLEELRTIEGFLDDILVAINNAIATPSIGEAQIAAFKADAIAARSSINGSIANVTSAKSSIDNAEAALEIAEQNLEQGVVGAQEEDVRALEAAVSQAEAGLSLARANLARTLIVSPISGTVNSLSLRRGEFVSAFELAAIVSNNNALEIESFVTESDKNQIRVGSKATIDGNYEGVVTSVSPGLDPITKKVEVRIGVVGSDVDLTNGSSVRVDIDRNGFEIDTEEIKEISIPISALKVETNRIIVFTVNGDNTLEAHEVTPGLVLGDTVRIDEGLTADMNIVRDARGLREGQSVSLNEVTS